MPTLAGMFGVQGLGAESLGSQVWCLQWYGSEADGHATKLLRACRAVRHAAAA